MFRNEYEMNETVERDHDYWLVGEGEEDTYRAWSVVDEKFVIAVEDCAPEKVFDAVEREGYEPVWASTMERARIKKVKSEISEETAYYEEEPPDEVYDSVGRKETLELLDHRGVDVGQYRDSWWYPEKYEFVAVFDRVDATGESARMVWRSDSLSTREKELILEGGSMDNEESDEEYIEKRGREIYENSPFSEPRSKILAGMERGLTNARVAKIINMNNNTVNSHKYQLVAKWRAFRWVCDEELDEVLNDEVEKRDGNEYGHD